MYPFMNSYIFLLQSTSSLRLSSLTLECIAKFTSSRGWLTCLLHSCSATSWQPTPVWPGSRLTGMTIPEEWKAWLLPHPMLTPTPLLPWKTVWVHFSRHPCSSMTATTVWRSSDPAEVSFSPSLFQQRFCFFPFASTLTSNSKPETAKWRISTRVRLFSFEGTFSFLRP